MREIIQKNKFFLILFLIWVLIASVISFLFTDKEIFFFINQNHNLFFDKVMTVLSAFGRGESVTIIFLSLLIFKQFRNKFYLISTISFGIIVPLLVYLSKLFFDRTRPIGMYGEEAVHYVPWLTNLVNNSFPSGHSMGAFGLFFYLNYFTPLKNQFITFFYFILSLGCAYSRIYLGQHYFTDVLAGSIFGVVFGILILWTSDLFIKKQFK